MMQNRHFLRFIHNNIVIIFINFFRRVLSEFTEVITTSLLPLEIICFEKFAFIMNLSCTMWTKMRSLAGSLTDAVVAEATLISPRPLIPLTNTRKVRGRRMKYGNHEKKM